MRWRSILSKYPIIVFNNFSYSRHNSLRKSWQESSLLILISFLFALLVTPYNEIEVDTMTFFDILFVELSKLSSRISDFFPLPFIYLIFICALFIVDKN